MAHSELSALEQALGYRFKKTELLTEALTHRSHYHEFGDSFHNERLEFLGDAVIDLCVTEALMRLSPDTDEGDLSKMRSQLVSESSLAKAALRLDLGSAVRLGRGEDLSGGRKREALLSDTFEAVMAAVYQDGGLDEARRVVLAQLENVSAAVKGAGQWKEATESLLRRDFKSRLQELCQALGLGAPTYRCVETCGPDHARSFVMALYVQEKEVIRHEGLTKKEATQSAAQNLLDAAPTVEALAKLLNERGVGTLNRSPSRRALKKTKTQEGHAE